MIDVMLRKKTKEFSLFYICMFVDYLNMFLLIDVLFINLNNTSRSNYFNSMWPFEGNHDVFLAHWPLYQYNTGFEWLLTSIGPSHWMWAWIQSSLSEFSFSRTPSLT